MHKNRQLILDAGGREVDEPVECLGLTFQNDEERREHFLGILREKLKDPEFRKTPGFPKGSDEDIQRLSDPPYYTACPNRFLEDFVRCYGKPYDPAEPYYREPFAVDVSEGKTDALYKAHGYHTKVPHLAIVPSILHYTKPGDIVLDGFCGSGMTGVAAQWCGAATVEYRRKLEQEWREAGLGKPEWGARRAILGDLSPAATFIAANYNLPFDVRAFEKPLDNRDHDRLTRIDRLPAPTELPADPMPIDQMYHGSRLAPNGGLERRFEISGGSGQGVWEFVRSHLKQLPVFVTRGGEAETIAERQDYFLYDRMVALHVQRGMTVPLSAAEFYRGLAERNAEHDGMWFLPEQVAEYDRKRLSVRQVLQLQIAVSDEQSAIEWMRQQLLKKRQTFQELQPQFMDKTRAGWQKHEKPLELAELLELNFLRYDGKGPVPGQIVAWMRRSERLRELISSELRVESSELDNPEPTTPNPEPKPPNPQLSTQNPQLLAKARDRWYVPDPKKAEDLEKLRERALLREFEEYRESKQRRIRVFRLEAVRAGFKKAWQERDYATIIAVAQKISENVLQEDPKLLMWYDQAVTRSGDTG
jgi:hypothetical protein